MPKAAPATQLTSAPSHQVTRRLSRHERGYTNEWAKAAKRFIASNPLCQNCDMPAKCVDHIIPHRGNTRLFWDVRNWQQLCLGCHSEKTIWENAAFPLKSLIYPVDIPTPKCRATVLFGPPGAGKSTWARQRPNATVIDLDEIRYNLTGVRYSLETEYLENALRMRNTLLQEFQPPNNDFSHEIVLIVTGTTPHERAHWQYLLDATVVCMPTPEFACIDRIGRDPLRTRVREEQIAAVRKWWRRYRPRRGELVEGGR